MVEPKPYMDPPKSQVLWIQGFQDYVKKHFGSFSFSEVRCIRPETPVYDSIIKMHRAQEKLQEEEELGGCCGILPTDEVVIYLVNKHKRGHKLPFYGLLFEIVHLAKPDWSAEEVERETSKHLNSAMKYTRVSVYNATHKRKKPYPK